MGERVHVALLPRSFASVISFFCWYQSETINHRALKTMGAHRHAQGRGTCPHLEMLYSVFVHCKMLSRRIIKFMHYFHNLFSSGALPQIPLGLHPWTPLGDFRPRPIICPPLEKSCGRPWSRLYTSCYGIRTDSPCISIKRPQRFYATNHSGKMLML